MEPAGRPDRRPSVVDLGHGCLGRVSKQKGEAADLVGDRAGQFGHGKVLTDAVLAPVRKRHEGLVALGTAAPRRAEAERSA